MNKQEEQKQILHRKEVLEKTRVQLKLEFVGIDGVIDRVLDSLSAWWIFPYLQERPVVLNLWGLTGVGKTSLVKRITELLDFDKRYFHFDLGNKEVSRYSINKQLEEIHEHESGKPTIISFDEVQYVRTLDEDLKESKEQPHRIIWQLLDSGKFMINRSFATIYDIYDLQTSLRKCLRLGVQVENGQVTEGRKLFFEKLIRKEYREYADSSFDDLPKTNHEIWNFIPLRFDELFLQITDGEYEEEEEIRDYLNDLNGKESMVMIDKFLDHALSQKEVDCSKSLIFIMGNLDEAYTMSGNLNPDIDADHFHEQTLKISITDIKRALRQRFRSEQIGRLGNTHIIYPSLNRAAYIALIELELERMQQKVLTSHAIQMQFNQEFKELIYQEGVYPTLGTRPLFTTIQQMVNANLGLVISDQILHDDPMDFLRWTMNKGKALVEVVNKGKVVRKIPIRMETDLQDLRKSKKDDQQALVAVHESGHALLSCLLMRVLPAQVVSVSASSDAAGFVYTDFPWDHIAKWEIRPRLAILLGGMVAEKLVFGEDYLTAGSGSDLSKATSLILQMYKQNGMGDSGGSYSDEFIPIPHRLKDRTRKLERQAEEELQSAIELARNTLEDHKSLLLRLADYLSDHRQLDKQELKDFLRKHAPEIVSYGFIEGGENRYYRETLKQQVANLDKPKGRPYAPAILERHLLNKEKGLNK